MEHLDPRDEEFLKLNARLGTVPESRILAAVRLQAEEAQAGRPPRSLQEILEAQGFLSSPDPESSAPPPPRSPSQVPSSSSVTVRPTGRAERPSDVEEALKDERNVLGHYVLLDLVGKGGMGSVYRAWDDAVGRIVAIKRLHESSQDSVERFLREAHLAGRLRHPSIATIYEVGEVQGRHYIAMQYIDGEPIGRRPRRVPQTLELVRDAARALQHAHDQDIIHRDVKPGNIMVDRKGAVFLTDFGLARDVVPRPSSALTMTGMIVGTVEFMSPEQARGSGRIDARSDVYSLGATLYRLLAGRSPHRADNVADALRDLLEWKPPPIRTFNSAISPELDAAVERAMAKDREKRFTDAGAFADELDRLLRERRYLGRYGLARLLTRRWLPVVAAALLAALGVRFWLERTGPVPPVPRRADPAALTRVAQVALDALERRLGTAPPEERRSRLQREVLARLDEALLADPRFLPARVARVRALYLDGRASAAREELRPLEDEWRRDYRIRFLRALLALEEAWGPPPLPALDAPLPAWHSPPPPWPASAAGDLRATEDPRTDKAAVAEYERDGPAARALLSLVEGRFDEAASALEEVSGRQTLPLYARARTRAAYLARRFREVRASPASGGSREHLGARLALSETLRDVLPECAGDAEASALVHLALARRALEEGRDPEASVAAGLEAAGGPVAFADAVRGALLACGILRRALSGRDDEAHYEEALRLLGPAPGPWPARLAAAELRLARGAGAGRGRGGSGKDLEEAVTLAQALSAEAPGWAAPKLVRAAAYLRLGRPHDALGELSGLQGQGGPRARIHSASVKLLLAEERRRGGLDARPGLEEALQDAAAALAEAPEHPEALNVAGAACLALAEEGEDRLEEALGHLDRALAAAPGYIEALLHRGQARFLLAQARRAPAADGDFGPALRDLDAALEAAPGFGTARWTRGVVRFSAGRYDDAARDWRLLPAGSCDEWIRRAEARSRP